MNSRMRVVIIAGLPVIALISLLIWSVTTNGDGTAPRPGVNDSFGVVAVTAPDGSTFDLPNLDGSQVRLEQFRGKVVVIDFWSSWCPPCIAEIPTLVEAERKWRDRGVVFVGVAIWDTEEAVRSFVARNGVEYTIVLDDNGHAAVNFGVSGLPEKFFIRPDGSIARKVVGPSTPSDLDKILGEVTDESLGFSTGT